MDTSKLKLWEVALDLEVIGAKIADAGGDISPELEAELDALEGAFEVKAENIALFIRECEANAAAARAEEERLGAIRKHFETKAAGLKSYLFSQMIKTGHQSVKTTRVKVWTQKNGRPSIKFVGEALPFEYQKITISVDTQKAYEDWKADAASLPAGFIVEQGSHLRLS